MAGPAMEQDARMRKRRVDAARLALLERAPGATLKELLTATLDAAEDLTGSRIGFLHFVEEDQQGLWLQAWSTNTTARMCTAEGSGSHYPIAQAGVWADCVRERRPLVHNDYASHPARRGLPPGHAEVVRELTVPVIRAGRVCAVLGVGNKSSDYLPEDVEDVATLADLAWDIAARKRAEDQVRAAAVWARNLIEASLDPLVTISPEGKITDVNAATEAATGVPRDQLVGTDFADYFTEPDDARAGYRKVLAEGSVRDYPLTIRHATGRTTDVLYNASVLRGEDGAVQGVFAAARDVTEVHALQAQLAMSSRLAAMGSLVAGVAHEVKNPLTAALADLELVLPGVRLVRERLDGHGPLDRAAEARFLDQVIEQLEDVQEGARRIERLVKELKVFAQPDQGRARLRLVDVVEKAMRWLPASVGKAATVQVENAGPPDVIAAFGQIEQVVVNLVTNAARASKPGRAGLVIIRIGPGSPGMARLEVVDHGIGIEPRLLRRIFEPFVRVGEDGRSTGLGLAVCHSIAVDHGGTLTAESVVGEGSRFRMELPAAPDPGPEGVAPGQAPAGREPPAG